MRQWLRGLCQLGCRQSTLRRQTARRAAISGANRRMRHEACGCLRCGRHETFGDPRPGRSKCVSSRSDHDALWCRRIRCGGRRQEAALSAACTGRHKRTSSAACTRRHKRTSSRSSLREDGRTRDANRRCAAAAKSPRSGEARGGAAGSTESSRAAETRSGRLEDAWQRRRWQERSLAGQDRPATA